MPTGSETLEDNLEQDTTEKELNKMRPEISARDNILKEAFVKVDFGNPTSMATKELRSIINKIETKFENEDSARVTLLKNPQIQTFLALLISEHKQARELKRSLNKNGKNLENPSNNEVVESWEDYVLRESSPENFENFLLSDEGIRVLKDEIDNHIDKDGNFYENYKISEKILKIKLGKCWYNSMHRKYNLENNIFSSEESIKLRKLGNIIVNGVDKAVGNYLKENKGNNFDDGMVEELESLLSSEENKEIINEIASNDEYKDEFRLILKESIRKYYNIILKNNDVSLESGDEQISLQLKSYLYIYGKTFYPESFKNVGGNEYGDKLLKVMKAILKYDGKLESLEKNEFFEKERKAEKERELRDLQRRQEATKRNRERNNQYSSNKNSPESKADNTSNSDNKTGSQIVKESGVDLRDINVNNNMSEEVMESGIAKQTAFGYAWKNFSENNPSVRDIFTPKDMRSLYDINSNTINIDARNNFLNTDIMKGRSTEEIKNIYNILASFPNEYSNALNHVASNINKQEGLVNNEIKNHALGLVIDNVRDIFDNIVQKWKGDSKFEGFKFNDSEPVKREGNNIIISGTFDGKDIKVRYDLISGGLFMNSYIKQSLNPSKFVIGDNSEIDYQIGELDSFDTILSKNYSTPDISLNYNSYLQNEGNILNKNNNNVNVQNNTNAQPNYSQGQLSAKSAINRDKNEIASLRQKYSEMLHSNIDMIGEKIIGNTKKQSAKNSVVINFMKTFNIITDNQEDKSLEFNDGSNLFDFIQLVENSDSQTLDKFQIFMRKIINPELSGLEWGKNNLLGSKLTFDKNNFNKNKSLVINNIEDFSNNPEMFNKGNVQSFGSSQQLGFAQLIIDNITDDSGKPNWKLDPEKMDKFIYHLETDGEKA